MLKSLSHKFLVNNALAGNAYYIILFKEEHTNVKIIS